MKCDIKASGNSQLQDVYLEGVAMLDIGTVMMGGDMLEGTSNEAVCVEPKNKAFRLGRRK